MFAKNRTLQFFKIRKCITYLDLGALLKLWEQRVNREEVNKLLNTFWEETYLGRKFCIFTFLHFLSFFPNVSPHETNFLCPCKVYFSTNQRFFFNTIPIIQYLRFLFPDECVLPDYKQAKRLYERGVNELKMAIDIKLTSSGNCFYLHGDYTPGNSLKLLGFHTFFQILLECPGTFKSFEYIFFKFWVFLFAENKLQISHLAKINKQQKILLISKKWQKNQRRAKRINKF